MYLFIQLYISLISLYLCTVRVREHKYDLNQSQMTYLCVMHFLKGKGQNSHTFKVKLPSDPCKFIITEIPLTDTII